MLFIYHLHRRQRRRVLRICDKPTTVNSEFDTFQPDLVTVSSLLAVFNIGSSHPTVLLRFIEVIE